jgi:hypothetical protein
MTANFPPKKNKLLIISATCYCRSAWAAENVLAFDHSPAIPSETGSLFFILLSIPDTMAHPVFVLNALERLAPVRYANPHAVERKNSKNMLKNLKIYILNLSHRASRIISFVEVDQPCLDGLRHAVVNWRSGSAKGGGQRTLFCRTFISYCSVLRR